MAQNIYDDPDFFAGYSQLPRAEKGLLGAPEWPSIRRLLPELAGRRVADLGCGFGWFCRWARQQGAVSVTGYDLSKNMLQRARQHTKVAGIEYVLADLEELSLPSAGFDFAYSSLALHYVVGLDRLLGEIHGALVPGSQFVFTVEHPMFTAPATPAWVEAEDGRRSWVVNGYGVEGPRRRNWFTPGVLKQHRMLGTTINALIGAGFTIEHVEEWRPSAEELSAQPALAEELERPMMLLVKASR